MAEIPKHYLSFIQKACDIDGNGRLENNAQKDGQTYDEISIFNKACESYDDQAKTVELNGVVTKISDIISKIFEPIKEAMDRELKQSLVASVDVFNIEPVKKAKQDVEIQKQLNAQDMSQSSYFEKYLSLKDWAKNRLESDMRDKTVQKNLAKFEPFFKEAAETYGVPKNVLKAICLAESTMGKWSRNVMRINSITRRELKFKNVNNPRMCIMKAAELLKSRLEMSDGNIAKALVGYNVGYNKPAFQNWKEVHQGGYADKVLSFALAFDELDKQNKVT